VKVFSKSVLVLLALAVGRHACLVTFAAHSGHRWLPFGMAVRRRDCGDCNKRRSGRAASLEAYRPLQRERAAGKARQDSRQVFGGGVPSKIDATILFDSARCTYSGTFSGSSEGRMDCSRCRRNSSFDLQSSSHPRDDRENAECRSHQAVCVGPRPATAPV
jgi:hypothetical protein